MKKLKFSTLSLSFKSVIMAIMVFFAVNNANAWVGETLALTRASVAITNAKASLDPINPSATTLAKMKALEGIITDIQLYGKTIEVAYYDNVVFDTTGTPNTPKAIPAIGVDAKVLSEEIYALFQ